MIKKIQIEEWIEGKDPKMNQVLLDVRSPVEYEQGHIPGSINFSRTVPRLILYLIMMREPE